ncbi:SAM-dependent methyltransferase [Actinophytocola oryzae]|uniref:Cyclopropane-fatty-acyl-phospholipid synthase n=1 Tax=Actinophytocola oryzae TaxID=502181 RepID=A0A4R7VUR4_9PSEU|nr:cyclopropane-fatty-acyl-phospholipid synthase family protein [Actinophytocola oryzae]TDV53720.1 cyclopropane-fatty-acyl-phospholipid synthase [Actinophytocola oryzae]
MGNALHLVRALEEALGGALPVGVRTWDGGRAGPDTGPTVVINNRRALRRLLWSPGELGLARAYVTGDLDVDGDLKEGLRRCWSAVRDKSLSRPSPAQFVRLATGAVRLGVLGLPPRPPVQEARLTGRLHAIGRDRAAISHHYDLGNDFYELILDADHMAYSCAWWADGATTVEEAQRAKLDMVCRNLELKPGTRMLDVGCGWGSLVLHAAAEYGAEVTGVTISRAQYNFVTRRARERGLDHLVTVRLQDYRHVDDGPYDVVSSIEMGEHVGEENYPAYVAVLRRNLREDGRLVLQQMSRGAVAPGGGAFIESYIAPDMTMRPLHRTLAHLAGAGFEIREVLAMREHYVRTIDAWAATLEERWDEVVARVGLGWARVWRLYMAGSALAFEEKRMGVDLVIAVA